MLRRGSYEIFGIDKAFSITYNISNTMQQFITSITQKSQVTIPKDIREELNLQFYDRVIVERAGDFIKIKPTLDILDLAGTFKPAPRFRKRKIDDARRYMEKHYKRV